MTTRELVVLLLASERVEIPSAFDFFCYRLAKIGLLNRYNGHWRATVRGEQLVNEVMCEVEEADLALSLAATLEMQRRQCLTKKQAGKKPTKKKTGKTAVVRTPAARSRRCTKKIK